MKKYFTFIFICVFFTSTLNAQQVDTAIFRVIYTYKKQTDSTTNNYRTENMVLHVGKSGTEYFSGDEQRRKDKMRSDYNTNLVEGKGRKINANGSTSLSKIVNNIYDKRLTVYQWLMQDYFYNESYPKINWIIKEEFKLIGSYKCVKAEGDFRGRRYSVWFTPEIPIQCGPWKLCGLPGLILEATDSKEQYVFLFSGIEKLTGNKIIISYTPESYRIQTTKKEYRKLYDVFSENPEAFINQSSMYGGIDIKVTNSTPITKKAKINNPIELTDD